MNASPCRVCPFSALLLTSALLAGAPLAPASEAFAQKKQQQQQRRGGTRSSSPRRLPREQQQREAVAALLETAEAARTFDDLFYKVKIQAAAAGDIWPFDEPAARAILLRAWEETTRPGALDAMRQDGEPPETARENLAMAQRMVIEEAAKYDHRMAESLIGQSLVNLQSESGRPSQNSPPENASTPRSNVWRQLSQSGQQRLGIAYSLLRGGAYKRAAEIAAPSVYEGASRDILEFIFALRAHNAREADALYLRLLERARTDAETNANDVLLLSTPVVSPLLLVFIDRDGTTRFLQRSAPVGTKSDEPAALPTEARRAFFNMAAAVLLRLPIVRETDSGVGAETATLYFTIGRLLPFFEREAAQYAPALHARQSSLSAEIAATRRDFLSASMNVSSLARKNPRDPLARGLEALGRATDAKSRDRLRFDIVISAASFKLWDRARRVAAEIEDAEAQRSALYVITLCQMMTISEAYDDAEADGFEGAVSFVRSADVPPEARATGLAQVAESASLSRRPERAAELLAEATTFAGEVPPETVQRAAVFAMLTLAAARIDAARAGELLTAFVSAANGAGDALSYELSYEFEVSPPGEKITIFLPQQPFRLEEVFATMARLDFHRTLNEIRALEDDVTRAEAIIAAARTVLRQAKEKRRRVKGSQEILISCHRQPGREMFMRRLFVPLAGVPV